MPNKAPDLLQSYEFSSKDRHKLSPPPKSSSPQHQNPIPSAERSDNSLTSKDNKEWQLNSVEHPIDPPNQESWNILSMFTGDG